MARPKKTDVAVKGHDAQTEKTYTETEVKQLLNAAVEKAVNKALSEKDLHKNKEDEKTETVTVLFIAEVSPENVLIIPGYGSMRPGSYLEVPKKEFGGQFMSPLVRKLIHKRHLIVLNGLTADERIRYDCDYKEGEVLTEKAFDHILDYEAAKLGSLFEKLCAEHQKFVCRRIITAFENGDNRINIEKVKTVNDISKATFADGLLKPVVEAYRNELL